MKGGRREDAAGDVEKRRSPVPSVPIALCLWWVFHRALIGLPRTGPLIFFRGVTGRYGLEISPLGSLRADRMARNAREYSGRSRTVLAEIQTAMQIAVLAVKHGFHTNVTYHTVSYRTILLYERRRRESGPPCVQ